VLQRDPFALQLAGGRALHLALAVPGVVLVLGALWPVAGRAWILHARQGVDHRLDGVIGRHGTAHGLEEERDVGVGQAHPQLAADGPELVRGGKLRAGHGDTSFWSVCYAKISVVVSPRSGNSAVQSTTQYSGIPESTAIVRLPTGAG